MFATCYTYRQAAWAPDQVVNGGGNTVTFSSTALTGVNRTLGTNFTTTTAGVPSTTRITTNYSFSETDSTNATTWEGLRTSIASPGVSTQGDVISITRIFTNDQFTVASGTSTVLVWETATTFSTRGTVSIFNLYGTSTFLLFNSTFFQNSVSWSWYNKNEPSFGQTSSSSTSGSGLTSTSSSTGTAPPVVSSAIISSVTTVHTAVVNIISTTTTTAVGSQWTVHAGAATQTTAASTITRTLATTTNIACPSTTTISALTPVWWGWSSENGTALVATANTNTDDLPAVMLSAAGEFGLWNFTASAQTTVWPSAPTGVAGSAASVIGSAITNVTFITMDWSTIYTVFGTFSFSTTLAVAIAPFSQAGEEIVSTALNPLSTSIQSITSYSTTTSTQTATFWTPFNSTTVRSSLPTVFPGFVTALVTELNLTPGHDGSFSSSYSLTTLVPGYTTASWAVAIGNGQAITQTAIVSGPGLSVTTTTKSGQWHFDTSCPTLTFTSSSTAGTSTSGISTSSGSTVLSIPGLGNFTHNLFGSPMPLTNPISVVSNSSVVNAPPAAASWQAIPSMQGFSPWTAQSVTYQSISAPTCLPVFALLARESGRIVSFDGFGNPVTTTATGLWALAASALTSVATTTATTTGGGTVTINGTSIAGWTSSTTWKTGASSITASVKFPPNMDETAATIFVTTSTAGGSSSATYAGFTFAGPVTATFMESAGFTSTNIATQSIWSSSTLLIGTNVSTSWGSTTVGNFVTQTANTTSGPILYQFAPGIGGTPKLSTGQATVYACGAALSLFGGAGSTWSSADLNFFQVVVGGTYTTSSSALINLGAGTFAAYTIPGVASLITSPAISMTTQQNRFNSPASAGTGFWLTPDPAMIPNQIRTAGRG